MLSTDSTRALYDRRAAGLFEKYGGGDWPSAILPNAFNDTSTFGGFGYGKVIVDELGIVRSVNEFGIETVIKRLFVLQHSNAKTAAESKARGEYWYSNKSWRHYEEEGIANEDIDAFAAKAMHDFRSSNVTVNDNSHSINSIEMNEGRLAASLRIDFNDGDQLRLVIKNFGSDEMSSRVKYYKNTADSGSKRRKLMGAGNPVVEFGDNGEITIEGKVSKGKDKTKHSIDVRFHESLFGIGDSQLKIAGDQAMLSGTLGTMTYEQIGNMIANHPEVKTIVMLEVEGSVNDEVNMHTGRIIREAGLNTRVLADSEIASGGVDLFCAGVKRTIEEGATMGVHSWSDGSFDGGDYPDDHPAHQHQLAYFKMMLGEQHGAKFYFYTLQAASANNIHNMSKQEIEQWKLAN